MAGLLELEKWCNALPDRIEKAANELARGAADTMAKHLIADTPVDVTTAVSNWQVSLNAPPVFDLPAIYPGEHGSTAIQSKREALKHVQAVLKEKDPGNIIYLSNLTPYINDLNAGTSPQARAGWIERSIRLGEIYGAQTGLRMTK